MTATRSLLAAVLLGAAACGGQGPTGPGATLTGVDTYFPSAGARLHYALDLPEGGGPFPAVVIGHGAGRVTKQEGAAHVPFWRERGFAVLRYDRRGVGLSTGTYRGMSGANSVEVVAELSTDMLAGVAFLRSRHDIDGGRIGLMGVSQAGWVMAAAASRSPDVRFFVAVVGSAMPVATNVYYENLRELPIDEAYARLAAYDGPSGWDPITALQSSSVPGLWLLGDDDRLVPTRACVPRLRFLDASARQSYRTYPGYGHELGGAMLYWPHVWSWLAAQGLS